MNLHKKIQYNIDQAAKNKWAPAWFGCVYFDAELVAAIEAYQAANNLVADGLCGPSTYRRIYTERESKDNSYIIHHGKPVLIHWPKVVLWMMSTGSAVQMVAIRLQKTLCITLSSLLLIGM